MKFRWTSINAFPLVWNEFEKYIYNYAEIMKIYGEVDEMIMFLN